MCSIRVDLPGHRAVGRRMERGSRGANRAHPAHLPTTENWTWPWKRYDLHTFHSWNSLLLAWVVISRNTSQWGSSSHKVQLLKHPESLQGPIEILSLSPTLLVALQDYCSSYSSVSKRLNHPLEKATVSRRRRAHLCSFLQETDFSEKKINKYRLISSLTWEEAVFFFFNWGWWECAIVCMQRNFLTTVNPFTELDKANNNNSNNNGVFVYLLNTYSILHTILSSIIHELSDLMVTSAFCVSY